MLRNSVSILLVFVLVLSLNGETIKVGFEPMPPLILDENNGYTVKLLKEIEKIPI